MKSWSFLLDPRHGLASFLCSLLLHPLQVDLSRLVQRVDVVQVADHRVALRYSLLRLNLVALRPKSHVSSVFIFSSWIPIFVEIGVVHFFLLDIFFLLCLSCCFSSDFLGP